jgi:hypothetical protein
MFFFTSPSADFLCHLSGPFLHLNLAKSPGDMVETVLVETVQLSQKRADSLNLSLEKAGFP